MPPGFRCCCRGVIRSGFRLATSMMIGLVSWLILVHMSEIAIWGAFYWWRGCLPDAESACYFSGVTYTTLGYGDLILPRPWRMLAPLEALTGILMCGVSASLFFAIISRWIGNWMKLQHTP